MTVYSTGTVTVTNNSTTVIGNLTDWEVALLTAGATFYVGTFSSPIAAIVSNTQLTLELPFVGTGGSGKSYRISRVDAFAQQTSLNAEKIAALLDRLPAFTEFGAGLAGAADGTEAAGLIGAVPASGVSALMASVFPKTTAGEIAVLLKYREKLTTGRNFYVRIDGNDANDGLTNTAGGAFRTIQKAVNAMFALDFSTHNCIINVGDGTYSENVELSGRVLGTGTYRITGNTTTPANCVTNFFRARGGFSGTVEGFKCTSNSGGIIAAEGSSIAIGDIRFSGTTAFTISDSATVTGNSRKFHFEATVTMICNGSTSGKLMFYNAELTVSGNTWGAASAFYLNTFAYCWLQGATWTGSATGKRYSLGTYAILSTAGQATTWIPGSIAGTAVDALYK